MSKRRCKAVLPVQRRGETIYVRCVLAESGHVQHAGSCRRDDGQIVKGWWGGANRTIVSPGWSLVERTNKN